MTHKLVNAAGLEEFAVKIRENVPLIGSIGSGTGISIDSIGSYSLEEVETPFTWIDGKKIYKKTINFGALPNATAKDVYHDINNFKRVIKVEGIMTYQISGSTGLECTVLPFASCSRTEDNIEITIFPASIRVYTKYDWSQREAIFTLYYTKS